MASSGSGLGWYWRRLRLMSGAEILHRIVSVGQVQAEKRGLLPLPQVPPRSAAPRAVAPAASVGPIGIADARPYLERADAVLRGELDVFVRAAVAIGNPPDWLRDPLTGTRLPLEHGASMAIVGRAERFDIKGVWEPARHQQWPWLVQAWLLGGDTRYLDGLREQLRSWLDANPFPLGPHWASALEPALRLINWSWIWRMTGGADGPLFAGQTELLERFYAAVYLQQRFIAGHLSLHSSANNHLVGEAAGWFVAARTWPLWPVSARWQQRAHALLEREIERQHSPDGVNREQAFNYQGFVNELFLAAALVPPEATALFSDAYWRRLELAVEFPAHVADARGELPQFGDADDGAALKLTPAAKPQWREQMALLAVLRGRGDFKTHAGRHDDALTWWLGADAPARWDAQPAAPFAARRDFRAGGYMVLGDGAQTPPAEAVRIVADVGPLGYLSIAAHGHADALSFTLSVGAQPLLVDPGTGCYSAVPAWRRWFRSTAAHNTVQLDGEDQSQSAGPFMWMRHARTCLLEWSEGANGGVQRLAAEHDGYARLAAPIVHRRRWSYDAATHRLEVRDEFAGSGRHAARWHWHFAPDVEVKLVDGTLLASAGGHRLTMRLPEGVQARLARGDEATPAGWYSGSYLRREPATCCIVEAEVAAGREWLTVLEIETAA